MTLDEQDIVNNISVSDLLQNISARLFSLHEENRRLKEKKTKWHKVADGDLPKESEFLKNEPDNHRYEWYIVAHVGKPSRALYSFAKKKWFIDYEEMMVGNYFEPIAWCEFPKYTEEEE